MTNRATKLEKRNYTMTDRATELEKLFIVTQSTCTTIVGLIGIYVSFFMVFITFLLILLSLFATRSTELLWTITILFGTVTWIVNWISVKLLKISKPL